MLLVLQLENLNILQNHNWKMAINKEELLFKKVFAGKASTDNSTAFFSETAVTNARLSVFSKDIWSEAHLIPDSGIGHITSSVTAVVLLLRE